jgi:arylsulfatase A-like enzyme
MGSRFYETPNIDRLAGEGMVFNDAYVNAGNCAPSRACLLSGQYTPRHTVYAVGSITRGNDKLKRLDVTGVPEAHSLAPDDPTMADALKSAGYATCCIGKWHLGNSEDTLPGAHGFDRVVGNKDYGPFKQTNDPKNVYAFTDAAIDFMRDSRERPFFLYLSHHAVHSPYHARQELIDKYTNKPEAGGQSDAKLAACIEHTDDSIGKLLAGLDELGLREDTVVVFFTDNGAVGKSTAAPLRGHKGMYYEGGIRVPMAVRWPGVTTANSKCEVPVSAIDYYPTFLDMAGAAAPGGKLLDGASCTSLLRGADSLDRDAIFWHFPGYLNGPWPGARNPNLRTPPVSVVRQGEWKLHLFHEEWALDGGYDARDTNNSLELYNLADDIGESKNLATANKAKRDELLRVLLDWQKSTNAPMATEKNATYDPTATDRRG